MATSLVLTSLNGAITQGQTMVRLTAFTNPGNAGIGPAVWLRVDDEEMLVTDASLSPTVQVVRGYNGTAAVAHGTLAAAAYGLVSDYTIPNELPMLNSYGADGLIAAPKQNTIVTLNKATAAAMTLAAPGVDQDGLKLIITSSTAAAHTVTSTPAGAEIFQPGTSAGPEEVATFDAYAGASITLEANHGYWNVLATVGVTVAD